MISLFLSINLSIRKIPAAFKKILKYLKEDKHSIFCLYSICIQMFIARMNNSL